MLRLQAHREFVRKHCIRPLGVVVVGCGDDGAVGGCGAFGGYDGDAMVGADGAEFLVNVVCLGENERLDDRTPPKGFLALGEQDQSS